MATNRPVVELWGIDWGMVIEQEWKKETPRLHRGEALEGPKGYTATGKMIAVEDSHDAKAAFAYRTRITKDERVFLRVGLTKKDAIDIAFVLEVAKANEARKALDRAERRMAELMKLELETFGADTGANNGNE
jgi:hypothetical protein